MWNLPAPPGPGWCSWYWNSLTKGPPTSTISLEKNLRSLAQQHGIPLVNTGMNDHEISWMHLCIVNTARGNLTDFGGVRRVREILQIRTPLKLQNLLVPFRTSGSQPFRMSHPKFSKDWNPGTFQKPAKTNTLETLWNLPNENLQRKTKTQTQIPRLEGKKNWQGKDLRKLSLNHARFFRQSNSESLRKNWDFMNLGWGSTWRAMQSPSRRNS